MNGFAVGCQRLAMVVGIMLPLSGTGGCAFSERSVPMRPGGLVRIPPSETAVPYTTRAWLSHAHAHLKHLLPAGESPALLTENLIDAAGQPIVAREHFKRVGDNFRSLWHNWSGISDSAQAIGGGSAIDQPAPPWEGFDDVLIPVAHGVQLAGRIGWAGADGRIREADCIVILPGLFGDNAVFRTRDLAAALRDSGLHALALEVRAHGQTEALNPTAYSTFGVLETVDLLLVSEWLEALPKVRDTGLIGFCWGANMALLTAWYDGRPKGHENISPRFAARLSSVSEDAHYRAGIMAFSTVWDFERLIAEMETPRGFLADPILATMQNTMRGRMRQKNHPEVSHSMRKLIDFEFARSELSYPGVFFDAVRFLRLMPAREGVRQIRLNAVRVPVLAVHAANDPLGPAQDLADLMAHVSNPHVAALILPGGGHVGFAPFARDYYFSLILNFFDSCSGPHGLPPSS